MGWLDESTLALRAAARNVAREFGPPPSKDSPDIWTLLFKAIERRSPGWTPQQYSDALNHGFRMRDDAAAELSDQACALADEYRDGKLRPLPADWDRARREMCAELERRCPGFTVSQYEDALQDGFKATR